MKRYDPYIDEEPYTQIQSAEMEEYSSGEYIKYSDYEQERKQLLKALYSAVKYIDALEEAVESCDNVVSDAVWANCPAIE